VHLEIKAIQDLLVLKAQSVQQVFQVPRVIKEIQDPRGLRDL
jgi:hypothetical protein